jgi:hypothetical protein
MCLAWESSGFERKSVFSATKTSQKAPQERRERRFLLRNTVFQAKHVRRRKKKGCKLNAHSPVKLVKLLMSVFSYSALRLRSQPTSPAPMPPSKIAPGAGITAPRPMVTTSVSFFPSSNAAKPKLQWAPTQRLSLRAKGV